MDILSVVLCVIFGVALIVIELFFIPGLGLAGIAGFASLVGGVVLAYMKLTPVYPMAGHITLLTSIVLTVLAIYGFWKSKAIEKMALDTTIDSSVDLAAPGKKIEKLEKDAQKLEEKETEKETKQSREK